MISFLRQRFGTSYLPSVIWAIMWAISSLTVYFHSMINSDVSWLLYAAERMQQGDVPYVDFYETNPPLILWLHWLPVKMAALLGVSTVPVFICAVAVLAAASLTLTLQAVYEHELFSAPRRGNIIIAALAAMLFGCSALVYGQREYLLTLFILPYVIHTSSSRPQATSKRELLIAAMAAIGFCIKPFFALIWVAGELCRAVFTRNMGSLLRPANLVIVSLAVVYIATAYLTSPRYFSWMLPSLAQVYSGFNAPITALIAPTVSLLVLYILPWLFMRRGLPAQMRFFNAMLLSWFAAACLTMLIQQKGWINHMQPAILFGSLLLAGMFCWHCNQLMSTRKAPTLPQFTLLWACFFILFGLPAYRLVSTIQTDHVQRDYTQQLASIIKAQHAEGKDISTLTINLGALFPSVHYLPVHFAHHYQHLWALPGMLKAESLGQEAPLKKEFIQQLVEDFTRKPPALVVLKPQLGLLWEKDGFDVVQYLSEDPAFKKMWRHYKQVGVIEMKQETGSLGGGNYIVYGYRGKL